MQVGSTARSRSSGRACAAGRTGYRLAAATGLPGTRLPNWTTCASGASSGRVAAVGVRTACCCSPSRGPGRRTARSAVFGASAVRRAASFAAGRRGLGSTCFIALGTGRPSAACGSDATAARAGGVGSTVAYRRCPARRASTRRSFAAAVSCCRARAAGLRTRLMPTQLSLAARRFWGAGVCAGGPAFRISLTTGRRSTACGRRFLGR